MQRRLMSTCVPILIAALSGCSLTPAYYRPAAPVARQWSTDPQVSSPHRATLEWKTFIVDPELRRLVTIALAHNRSLTQSLLDIEQARAQYRIQRAERLPNLAATATGSRQRSPVDLPLSEVSTSSRSYQVSLSLPEYELDLFGRVKNLTGAALEQYLATEDTAHAAQVSLVAEVSQAYLTYEGAQRRKDLARRTLASRESSLQLTAQRRSAGTATALDYQESVGLVEQSRAELEVIAREQQQAFNALVLLLGTPEAAASIPVTPRPGPTLLQEIATGAPSDLLEQRPDIRSAEHRLKARHADIGAARAAFFPRISLTGNYGSSSDAMSGLFKGGSRSWSFVPTLSLPIFDGGQNRANLTLAEVRRDSAVAEYEEAIQVAFREVADALAATGTLRREQAARQALADSSGEALKLARARYESGVDDHLRYLDAQRSSFANELALIETSTQRQIAMVNLFRSLGGGWSSDKELAQR